jgi:hypothetical protein
MSYLDVQNDSSSEYMLGGVTWEADELKEASKNGIDAYIWLYAGDHFLFSCATESEADFD